MRKACLVSSVLAVLLFRNDWAFGTDSSNAVSTCPAPGALLDGQPEFWNASNMCCSQVDPVRSCGSLDFCFGIALSHPSSPHSACCDNFPSCVSSMELFSTLSTLRGLSIADVVISSLIMLVLCCAVSGERDVMITYTCCLLILLMVDVGLCAAGIDLLRKSDAIHFIDELVASSCFKDPGDEASIGTLQDELQSYWVVTIAELTVGLVLVLLHCIAFGVDDGDDDGGDNGAHMFSLFIGFLGDLAELIMAIVGLAVFLLPAIEGFEERYAAMASMDSTSPCLRTCCELLFTGATIPAQGGAKSSPPSPLGATSVALFNPTAGPTERPSSSPELHVFNGATDTLSCPSLQSGVSLSCSDCLDEGCVVVGGSCLLSCEVVPFFHKDGVCWDMFDHRDKTEAEVCQMIVAAQNDGG